MFCLTTNNQPDTPLPFKSLNTRFGYSSGGSSINIPTIVVLSLIVLACLFVASIQVYTRCLAQASVSLNRSQYGAGDMVEGIITITARRTCKVRSARISLICWSNNPQNPARLTKDGWLYKVIQSVELHRTLSAGQVHKVSFALPMPKPGQMPTSAFFGSQPNPHSGVWSVSTEIDCNVVTLSAGEIFQLKRQP
jgi:hypothetical protein